MLTGDISAQKVPSLKNDAMRSQADQDETQRVRLQRCPGAGHRGSPNPVSPTGVHEAIVLGLAHYDSLLPAHLPAVVVVFAASVRTL